MTDIVERLREQPKMSIFANIGDMVGRLNHEREEAADEIERLRAENQELKLQYLSDQGQWIEETGRLRAALRIIAESCPSHIIRSKDADVNALLAYNAGLNARAALGEKE